MRDNIVNIANVNGTFNSLSTNLTTEAVITPLSNEFTINKTADKTMWADGNLTYVVEIKNDTALTYEDAVFTDIVDPTKARLIAGSLMVNGMPVLYNYDDVTGTITYNIGSVAAKETIIVQFQMQKFRNNWNRLDNEAMVSWGRTFDDYIKSNMCSVMNGSFYPDYNGRCCKKIGYVRCK